MQSYLEPSEPYDTEKADVGEKSCLKNCQERSGMSDVIMEGD